MRAEIIQSADDRLSFLMVRPETLEEAKLYPGSCLALAIWDKADLDAANVVNLINRCLTSIGHGPNG